MPIPSPPGPLGESLGKWDQALDEIYTAQRYCTSGLLGLRKEDFYKARMAATSGVALLHEVAGTER